MSELKPAGQPRKKQRKRGKVHDRMRESTSEDSPLSNSLNPLLTVQKVSILQKHKSFPGSSTVRSKHGYTAGTVGESSSNESFSSAKSQVSSSAENMEEKEAFSPYCDDKEVPLASSQEHTSDTGAVDETENYQTAQGFSSKLEINSTPSATSIIPDPELTDETLPSYEEETVPVNTRVPSNTTEPVLNCNIMSTINSLSCEDNDSVGGLLQSFAKEEPDTEPNLEVFEDLAVVVSSAATSQAFLEALSEDSDAQIATLVRVKDEEMQVNRSLRSRMMELETLKGTMDHLVADMEYSYLETYSELAATHENELELERLEATRQKFELESEIKELNYRLLVTQGQVAAKDELEAALHHRIQELEQSLRDKEKHCREELEGVVAKYMQCQVVSLAKSEIEQEMEESGGNVEPEKKFENASVTEDVLHDCRALVSEIVMRAEREVALEVSVEEEFDRVAMVADLHRASMVDIKDIGEGENTSSSSSQSNTKRRKRHLTFESEQRQVLPDATIDLMKSQLKAQEEYLNRLREENEILKNVKCEIETVNHEYRKKLTDAERACDRHIEEKGVLEMKLENVETAKVGLEIHLEEVNKKLTQIVSERDELLQNRLSLDAAFSELQKERDRLVTRNKELQGKANTSFLEKEKRLSLEAELEKLRMDFQLGSSRNQSLEADIFSVRKQLEELRADWSAAKLQTDRLDGTMPQLDLTRSTDATQYMDYMPRPPPEDAMCQVSLVQAEAACQTSQGQAELEQRSVGDSTPNRPLPRPPSGRRDSLEEDLETSWTERCEVEQRLAAALAENTLLRQRTLHLEAASRRACGLVETGVPSAADWLQLRSCVKEIVAELAVLRGAQEQAELQNGGFDYRNHEKNNPYNTSPFLPHVESSGLVCGRSSPEGGRESPRLTDGGLEVLNATDDDRRSVHGSEGDVGGPIEQLPLEHHLDENSSALLVMVQELLQCLGDENCSMNCSLDASLSERLSIVPGAGELSRRLEEVKEEVTRLFTLSQRGDPVVAKLQEEIRSLEQQVLASDKQVRSTRAFLEEQAVEREQERDEAAHRIDELSEAVRVRERQLANKQILEQDLEILEQQLVEAQSRAKNESQKRANTEAQLEQMKQKTWTLREILDAMEAQLAEKGEQLQAVTEEKTRLLERLAHDGQLSLERENAQRDSYSDTLAYVARLEEEVTSLRHRVEASGPESLACARAALRELEAAVVRRTRDLELVQVAWNGALSSASEELSTRDHPDATRCATPDEMAVEVNVGLCEDVERLRERLVKHARVEEAALKKIKELEHAAAMVENQQVDLEVAYRRVESLLSENEALKGRLELQRPRAHDNEVVADLERKIHELEKKLEKMEEQSSAEKNILIEKCRREERLQETLDARELELRQEAEAMNEVQEKLKKERALRLAAESRLAYMEQSRQLQLTPKAIERDSDDVSLSNEHSHSSPTKRVKFCTPESFVGKSLTPISPANASILRNVGSCPDDYIISEHVSREPVLWHNVSSLSALQLSPRAPFSASKSDISTATTQNSTLQKPTEPSITCEGSHRPEMSELLQQRDEEVALLKLRLEQSTRSLNAAEEKHNRHVHDLEVDFNEIEEELTRECEEMKETMVVTERALSQVQLQLQKSKEELDEQKETVSLLNYRLKVNTEKFEAEKREGVTMLTEMQKQYDNVTSQLGKLRHETGALQETLRKTCEELEMVKSEKEALIITEKQKLAENQLLKKAVEGHQEEAYSLKQQQLMTWEELDSLKREQEVLLAQETDLNNKIIQLESLRHAQEEKFEKFKKESEEKIVALNLEIGTEKSKVEEMAQKVEELEKCRALAEMKILEVKREMEGVRGECLAEAAERNSLQSENEKLGRFLREAEGQLKNAMARLQSVTLDKASGPLHSRLVGAGGDSALTSSAFQRERSEAQVEKFCMDAAGRVADLRVSLEASLMKTSSLETELMKTRSRLDESHSKVVALEAALEEAQRRSDKLAAELSELLPKRDGNLSAKLSQPVPQRGDKSCSKQQQQTSLTTSDLPRLDGVRNSESSISVDLYLTKMRLDDLVEKLEKVERELAHSREKEFNLRRALNKAVDLQKQAAMREHDLKKELTAAEREVLHLSFLADAQGVKARGLERLHQHGMALQRFQGEASSLDPRGVRSAGDGEHRSAHWEWTVQRLESYRKALIWQKRFLQGSAGCRNHNRNRPPKLRAVALMFVALFRMRFLVRRWKSRLPPLVMSPPRGRERPLMLMSPPCKDPGFRLSQIK